MVFEGPNLFLIYFSNKPYNKPYNKRYNKLYTTPKNDKNVRTIYPNFNRLGEFKRDQSFVKTRFRVQKYLLSETFL